MDAPIAETLGELLTELEYEKLDQRYKDKLDDIIVDTVACGFGGVHEPEYYDILPILPSPGKIDEATVFGTDSGATIEDAAFANVVASHFLTHDDRHGGASTHPGSIVVPVALAVGEKRNASGREILTAVLGGYEIIGRIGSILEGFNEEIPRRPTPVFGPFGAAVTAGLLLDFDGSEMGHAISYAANLAGGMAQVWIDGTYEYVIHSAMAAQHGILSAKLANEGFTASERTLEGKKGFFKAFFGTIPESFDAVFDEFGERYELDDVIGKPLPACGVAQVPILIAESFLEQGIEYEDVESVNVTAASLVADIPGCDLVTGIRSPTQALMSVPHSIASTFALEDYTREACTTHRDDSRIKDLREKVDMHYDDSYYKYEFTITVHLMNGESETIHMAEQPFLSTGDYREKFEFYGTKLFSEDRTATLYDRFSAIDSEDNIASLLAELRDEFYMTMEVSLQ